MFFGAYLGPEDQVDPWRSAVEQHAHWLNLQFTPSVWRQPNGLLFTCAWLSQPGPAPRPHLQATGDIIEAGTRYDPADSPPWQAESDPTDTNEARLRLVQSRGDLSVLVQPLSPEHLFYTMTARGIALSNDLRLLIRLTGLELDERGVFSLLQFGAIVPPFSISHQIQRIPNGHILRVHALPDTLTARVEMGPPIEGGGPLPPGVSPARAVRQTLDGLLERTPRNAAMFFGGGVASGLVAARLAAQGRRDVQLINFSFGSDDPESALAQAMAGHLGLRCEHIPFEQPRFMDVLWRAAKEYSIPFSDSSTLPTNMLVQAAIGRATRIPGAIAGVGAGHLFDARLNLENWKRLYDVPYAVRAAGGWMYGARRAWNGGDTRGARVGHSLRRSAQMPLLPAAHAQNALDGIAYRIPDTVRAQLDGALERYRFEPVRHLPLEDQFSLALSMHESCGYVAQTSFDPLRLRDIASYYPYLEPAMVRLTLSLTGDQKGSGGAPQALLKALLAEQLPQDMVYRRGSTFVPPYESMFTSRPMQSYVREVVLSPSSPLAPYFDRGVVERMIARADEWQPLSLEVYHSFLWPLIFLTAWLYPLYHR